MDDGFTHRRKVGPCDHVMKLTSHAPDHGVLKSLNEIDAVGHRVAHGGEYFSESVKIDDEAKAKDVYKRQG